jgi:hypothetical protein
VPAGVGVITELGVLRQNWLPIAVGLLVSHGAWSGGDRVRDASGLPRRGGEPASRPTVGDPSG